MRPKTMAIGACVSLAALIPVALAQLPGVERAARQREQAKLQAEEAKLQAEEAKLQAQHAQFQAEKSKKDMDMLLGFTLRQRPDAERLVNELLRKWKAAGSEPDRAKVEKELRAVLKSQFEARLGAHQKEIEQLEAKVKQLREQLELRRKKQDEIVDFRLQQLLREAQGLGWGTESVTRQGFPQIGTKWSSNASDDLFAKPPETLGIDKARQ